MEKDIYRGSRICYIMVDMFAHLISLLLSGAYLAKITAALGFSDGLTAILTSFVSLGCSFQLLALVFFKRGRVKRRVTLFFTLNQLLFTLLYTVPVFKCNDGLKTILFFVFLLGGYFLQNIVFSPKTNWFMSLVPDFQRGNFTAIKEAVSLIGGIIFSFAMSAVIDRYESMGNLNAAFTVVAITILILTVSHTLMLVLSKEKEPVETEGVSLIGSIKGVFCDKAALAVIGISIFWAVINNITTPFYGTYEIKELGFTMTFVSVLTVVNAVSRIGASFFLGRYADKTSFGKMLKVCYILLGLSLVSVAFAVPSNGKLMFIIRNILYGMAMGGINSAEINLIYDYVSPEKRTSSLAVKQTVYGLSGFISTLVATPLLSIIQSSGNSIFGMNIYAQQVLSAIAVVLVVLMIIYLERIVLKLKTYPKF